MITRREATPATGLVSALLAVGMLVAMAACSSGQSAPTESAVATGAPVTLPAEVSVAQAATMREAGAFVLDVREPDEWAAGHIPGATLIPLGALEGRLAELPGDRDIVVVCRSGNRSAQARDILRAGGLSRSTSMTGGVSEWVAAGLPTESGG